MPVLAAALIVVAQLAAAQLSTAEHLADPGFWPTQDGASRADYVGSAVCASCHAAKAASQKNTGMAESLHHAADSEVLRAHPHMSFQVRNYHYQVETSPRGSIYRVTDGAHTLAASLLWAFGTGKVGQSYLFKKEDGKFYEARVTYFDSLHNLDFTPARELDNPKDIDEAMYRPVDSNEIRGCFACHTTGANIDGRLDEKNLVPGVSCEACHGAGRKHVEAAEAAQAAGAPEAALGTIFNPAQLLPVDSVDFCGACHGTFWDVKLSSVKGAATVKAQPYRLATSKCSAKSPSPITCMACHDPHEPLETQPAAYDAACLKCHANAGKGAAAVQAAASAKTLDRIRTCPISGSKCVTCHMPKVYVPEMKYSFTDHRIRIAGDDKSYPE